MDPELPWSWLMLFMMKDRFLEMYEYALDLVILTGKPDRVSTLELKLLFPKFKRLYEANGHRLRKFVASCDSGYINWREFGHYTAKAFKQNDKFRLQMKCGILETTVLVDEAVTNGDDTLESAVMKNNFAIKSAFVYTTNDTYNASHFFPQLGRGLKRRLSEDVGATHVVPGGAEVPEGAAARSVDGDDLAAAGSDAAAGADVSSGGGTPRAAAASASVAEEEPPSPEE
jgi:hypothetical protein